MHYLRNIEIRIKTKIKQTPIPGYLRSDLSWFNCGFLLLRIFSVAISVSPHVCFILDLILISMFLKAA